MIEQATIGSDETLKGDTFGGLIVCAAYFSRDEIDVHDSKRYTENRIRDIATSLLEKYPDRFAICNLTPTQYNELFSLHQNQTKVLNHLHAEVGTTLKKKFNATHVVDEYPGCTVGDIREQKAENSYVSVAAASIVARYYAMLQFEELSAQAGFILPKGSTHVSEAVERMVSEQKDLTHFAKTHFATIKKYVKTQ